MSFLDKAREEAKQAQIPFIQRKIERALCGGKTSLTIQSLYPETIEWLREQGVTVDEIFSDGGGGMPVGFKLYFE